MHEMTPPRKAGLLHGPLFRSAPKPLVRGYKENIRIHADYPEKVIRYDPHPLSAWEIGLQTCDLLREEYGFAIPQTQISCAIDFRTDDPYIEHASVVAITDRVRGQRLLDVLESETVHDPAFISAFTTLSTGAARYLTDIYEYGGVCLPDTMYHGQFIYGNTAEDPEKKLYLVDIEPIVAVFEKTTENTHDIRRLLTYIALQKSFLRLYFTYRNEDITEARSLLVDLSHKLNNCLIKNST